MAARTQSRVDVSTARSGLKCSYRFVKKNRSVDETGCHMPELESAVASRGPSLSNFCC